MILTFIVIAVGLMSVASLALAVANREASQASRAAMDKHGLAGIPAGCLTAVSALAVLSLWTWYAFDQRDWRYAAIAWIPFVCNLLGRSATKGTKL